MPNRRVAADTRNSTDAGATWPSYAPEEIPIGEVDIPNVVSGMYTGPSEDQRPLGSALEILSGRCRRDFCGRRPGTAQVLTKPTSNLVFHTANILLEEDNNWILQVNVGGIWGLRTTTTGWVAFTGPTFPRERLMDSAQYLDKLYIATTDTELVTVDPTTQTYATNPEAPKARFVVAFADRVVAANIRDPIDGPIGTKIAWSGNGNPSIWDPLIDESAGSVVLDSAPSDQGDEITGLHVVGETLIILRERSVWLATRQPIAFAPFRFQALVSDLGCDVPYASASIPNGVVFVSKGNQTIYGYTPGSFPKSLTEQLGPEFLDDLLLLDWADATYDPFHAEFHFSFSSKLLDGTRYESRYLNKTWVYNFPNSAWTIDIGPIHASIAHLDLVGDAIIIDGLLGVIDAQVPDPADPTKPNPDGFIDDWGPGDIIPPAIVKGISTGEVVTQLMVHPNEWNDHQFEFEYTSQNVTGTSKVHSLKQVMLDVLSITGGKAVLEFSDASFRWKKQKTMKMDPVLWYVVYGAPRVQMTANRVYFRVRSTAPTYRFIGAWVRMLEMSRKRQRRLTKARGV